MVKGPCLRPHVIKVLSGPDASEMCHALCAVLCIWWFVDRCWDDSHTVRGLRVFCIGKLQDLSTFWSSDYIMTSQSWKQQLIHMKHDHLDT